MTEAAAPRPPRTRFPALSAGALAYVAVKLAAIGWLMGVGPGDIAANRRARLVEYCLASNVVTEADLPELDRAAEANRLAAGAAEEPPVG